MRLNRHIADTGFCSRREADRLIGEGRVTVNGVRARIGAELGEGDGCLIQVFSDAFVKMGCETAFAGGEKLRSIGGFAFS